MSEGSPLSRWAFGVLRPVVRLLRAAGLTEETIHAQVNRALALHRQDTVRGRIDAPMSQERVRALSNLLAAWSRTPDWAGTDGMPRDPPLSRRLVGGNRTRIAAGSALVQLRDEKSGHRLLPSDDASGQRPQSPAARPHFTSSKSSWLAGFATQRNRSRPSALPYVS